LAERVDRDHLELPSDALERLPQVCPADQQWFIEEVTQALAVAVDTKDFRLLQEVFEAGPPRCASSGNPATRRVIQADDEQERIGEGTHERFVVDMQPSMTRIATKGR
jgi:hypothetical protein